MELSIKSSVCTSLWILLATEHNRLAVCHKTLYQELCNHTTVFLGTNIPKPHGNAYADLHRSLFYANNVVVDDTFQ